HSHWRSSMILFSLFFLFFIFPSSQSYEVDWNGNVCFFLMKCSGGGSSLQKQMRQFHHANYIKVYLDEESHDCEDDELVMAVAVNPISARKFEFLVVSTNDSQMILGQKLLIKSGNATN
ncbi:hypothetical protein PFISCL1PPCAC_1527, partial [Pristionchus fissidentatus]